MQVALIFRAWATRFGSFGIQLPITIRPPERVTRTISVATSNDLSANMAPKTLTTRSHESSFNPRGSDASPYSKRQLVRPIFRGLSAATSLDAMCIPSKSAPSWTCRITGQLAQVQF